MHSRLFLVAVAFLTLAPAPAAIAQSDLEVVAAWQQYAAPGATVSFAFLVTNRGPQPDPAVTFFARPMFAEEMENYYAEPQRPFATLGVVLPGDGTQPDCSDDLSNPAPWVFTTSRGSCHVSLELCDPESALWPALHVKCDLGSLAVDETAAVTVSLPLVMDPPPEPALVFHEPADLGTFTLRAEDPSRGFIPAEFGESVYFGQPATGDLMLCHDHTAEPDRCCGQLIGDYTGKIALAERGDCEWVNKVMNAQQAGAVGAIVFNRYPFDDPSYGGYVRMPDNLGGFTHIPAVFIPQEAGQVLLAALQAGPVSLTMGPTFPSPWLFDVTGFTHDETDDPDLTDNEVTCEVWVGSGQVPVASFSVSPESPIAHRETQLSDTSTWNPTAWAWDFGDGQASTNQNPTHAWAEAGTYTVSLTVANAAGADTATRDVVVGEPVLDVAYLIPAAARVHGLEGAFFVSDAEVNNRGTGLASYRFRWLPKDSDNSTATSSERLTLSPGVSARYVDVVGAVFALGDAGGALAVDTDSADLMVTSRTYNRTATGGTLGQSIPGLRSDRLVQAGQRLRILQLVENDAFRSNLGLANGTGTTIVVELASYDTSGEGLGVPRALTLRPWENVQLVRVLADHAPVEGYADVWSDTPGAAFAAYASVVDNQTNDPTTVLPD